MFSTSANVQKYGGNSAKLIDTLSTRAHEYNKRLRNILECIFERITEHTLYSVDNVAFGTVANDGEYVYILHARPFLCHVFTNYNLHITRILGCILNSGMSFICIIYMENGIYAPITQKSGEISMTRIKSTIIFAYFIERTRKRKKKK